ncbi:hypothetical protein GWI33_018499 [Rhynchophorus ferrugineus]|uniref:Uncharacterized protein n=1 Tax=Rhynchophorus ferrugineus TaxID=354439 RepID=A0A834M1E0_RHYFE|nr:hypothetical protein GWI33_018499 [Rhynchophorus ferrugineus]
MLLFEISGFLHTEDNRGHLKKVLTFIWRGSIDFKLIPNQNPGSANIYRYRYRVRDHGLRVARFSSERR